MNGQDAPRWSALTLVGGLVAFALLALGGVIFIQPGPESAQRLALFFGILGTGVAAVAALLKAEQTARQTNGQLDERIRLSVYQAMDARRKGDPPATGPATAPIPATGQPSSDPASAQ